MLATAGYLLRFPLKSQGVRVKFWEFREISVLFMTLASYLEVFPGFPPSVPDPSGGKRTFDHRWDSLGYPAFRASVLEYARQLAAAYYEPDADRSIALWQDVFGPGYTLTGVTSRPVR